MLCLNWYQNKSPRQVLAPKEKISTTESQKEMKAGGTGVLISP